MRRSQLGEAMASSSRLSTQLREADAREICVPGKCGNYDVFLSHRGPDTKSGFTAYLHEKLKLAGLEAYFDCRDIEKGEDSWESIERAITNTRVALVIFSENFAGSKWCLKELHLMLKTPSITMLPIFYKVKPGDVGGSLSEGRVAKLQKQGCSMKEIKMWRNDLKIAATRGGWEYERNDKRLEPEIQRSIVQEVSNLTNKALISDGASEQGLVGVDLVAEQIIREVDVKKVVMLGLWGVGGIGKTTLAWEIYSRLRKREYYSASCCVKDVSEKVRQIDGVQRVQGDIFEGLCKGADGKMIKNEIDGKSMLERRLCKQSRFLLLLDDVSNEKDMMEYIISSKMLEGGSMCIVTTRDRGVLEAFQRGRDNVHIHPVGELSREDSKRAFAYYAFGGGRQVKPGFETLVEGMSKACGGVPLVLKVIGSSLNGNNDVEAWQEILDSGNICKIHTDVYDKLRTSYDRLSRDQQEIFLDIACGLIGEPMGLASRVWRSLNWSPKANVELLVKRALVSLDDKGQFVMHDVVRDMGRTIEMGKKPKRRARLWMPESLTKVQEKGLPKHLQTLVIKSPLWPKTHTLDVDVSHMKELRILICHGLVQVTSIPTNLRWFSSRRRWIESSFLKVSFPEISQESKLVVMDHDWLPKCQLSCKQGHQPPCTVQGLGGLTALECLRLYGCYIDELPNLQRLNKLEELDICVSVGVPGFGDLVKFKAVDCVRLAERHNVVPRYTWRFPNKSKAIPGLGKIMPNLTELTVTAEGLEIPDVVNATKLLTLIVGGWKERGPPAGINFMTLKTLTICRGFGSSCPKKLDGLLGMKNLESIFLDDCDFKDVSCLNHLTTLKSIHVNYCHSLEVLPDLRGLTRLESLRIFTCYRFREWALLSISRLFSRPALPSLQTLIFDWVAMKELPDNLEVMFPRLKTVKLMTAVKDSRWSIFM